MNEWTHNSMDDAWMNGLTAECNYARMNGMTHEWMNV